MSASKRVLITGASGFIGSGVLEHLLDVTDWDFTCVCSWRHHGNPLNVPRHNRVGVFSHDLAAPIPNIGDFHYILHLASESHVDRSIAEPVSFVENNVSSTLQMLEYARAHPPEMFVQFSTDEVYGATEHDEWDVLLPSNPYAASKAAQEMIAIAYWATFKVPVVITNSNNIVGPNQAAEKFIPKLIERISRHETVTIHTADGQPGKRHYNSVRNVASALMFILANPQPAKDRPVRFSLPGGEEVNNLEMGHRIAALLGTTMQFELVDAESVRPGYDRFYPRTDGALLALGWEPTFTLDDELRRVVSARKRS